MYFEYGENEITYLRNKDKKLSEVIDQIGMIEREVDTDLFSAVVHHIIGQQISTKAQATIWQRMKETLGEVNAETILSADISKLQSLGMTFRKAEYITDFARKVHEGVFDLEKVAQMSDEAAIKELASLKGIGVWTCFSVCSGRIYSAMMIWLSSVDFVWFIITARLTGSCLKSIAGGLVLTAVWPVCICGQWQAELFRE